MVGVSIVRRIIGIIFLILGVLGLFLPVLQGILFIFIGLALLFPNNQYVRKVLQKARDRYPEQASRIRAIKSKLARIIHEK